MAQPQDPGQLLAHAITEHSQRQAIADECLKVLPCDGADPLLVKRYLRDLNLVEARFRFEVLKRTARDGLLREVLRHITQQPGAGWEIMRTHLIAAFVSQDTDGVIKRELEAVRRQPYETIVSYNRRFRDLAEEAYPVGGRNAEQHEVMTKLYSKGLDNRRLAQKIVTPDWPPSIDVALTRCAATEKRGDNLQRLGYEGEEPMEIGATTGGKQPTADKPSLDLQRLQTHIAKLEAQIARQQAQQSRLISSRRPEDSRRQDRNHGPQDRNHRQGGPRDSRQHTTAQCWNCGKSGHLTRECRAPRPVNMYNSPKN